jgi:antitoxin (DNA-binding transcriptional repressor) of toxin-antitoxin stability system
VSTITLQEAQSHLAELVHLAPGESVTIAENDRPVARLLVPLVAPAHPPRTRPPVTGVPKAGRLKGQLVVPDDFDEPLEELQEYNAFSPSPPCRSITRT